MAGKPGPFGKGISADSLKSFIESLDTIEQEGCSYGVLISCVVAMDFNGNKVTATYGESEWLISVEKNE
jgi:hypothetical protein